MLFGARRTEVPSMRLEENITNPRLLRKRQAKPAVPGSASVQSEPRPDPESASPPEPKLAAVPVSHFVTPTHLDDSKKKALLKRLKRAKVGDETGRQIFVAALEYQLTELANDVAGHHARLAAAEPDPAADALTRLDAAIAQLVDLIENLPDEARARLAGFLEDRDPYKRGYGPGWFEALSAEFGRLRDAVEHAGADGDEPCINHDLDSAISVAFLARLSGVFDECFDASPDASPRGPFATAVKALCEVVGLKLDCHAELLTEALEKARKSRA